MFALAIWDKTRRGLFIARDHLGIKPLYYVFLGSRLLFASEIKALVMHPDCPRQVNTEALAELFTFRYVPSPKTLFQRIYKLPPGHSMFCTKDAFHIKRFWNWIPRFRRQWREADLIDEYQTLLDDAVRLQLRSDVPLGLFLSSGVDSSVLLAIMSKHCPARAQTFTIGFEGGEKENEVADARAIASMFAADHCSMTVTSQDYCSYYERYMRDLEEPVGHESAAAFFFVAKLAREHVKVALCGQGADEPWAGYDRYVGLKLSETYSRLPTSLTDSFGALMTKVPGRLERLKRGVISLGERDVLTRLTKVYSFFSAEMKAQLFTGDLRRRLKDDPYHTREAIRALHLDVQHLDPLTQALYIDTRANLPDDLLMVGDKTSMANSLEVRVPFLDYRLVEFVESLPPKLKLSGLTGKYLHKKALLKWLPKSVTYRKKKGFSNPMALWLRTTMRPLVDDCLLSEDSLISTFFERGYISTICSAIAQDSNTIHDISIFCYH